MTQAVPARTLVLGAGAWGTALAISAARQGATRVRLWARDPAQAIAIDRECENRRYLPGLALPEDLSVVSGEAAPWVADADLVVVATPMAALRGWSPFVGMQVQYSLIERSVERDILPMSREFGVGVTAWSPLGGGVLSGKYARADAGSKDEIDQSLRRASNKARANERNFTIVVALEGVAKETGRTPAQVAIRWLVQKPGVAKSTPVGLPLLSASARLSW